MGPNMFLRYTFGPTVTDNRYGSPLMSSERKRNGCVVYERHFSVIRHVFAAFILPTRMPISWTHHVLSYTRLLHRVRNGRNTFTNAKQLDVCDVNDKVKYSSSDNYDLSVRLQRWVDMFGSRAGPRYFSAPGRFLKKNSPKNCLRIFVFIF